MEEEVSESFICHLSNTPPAARLHPPHWQFRLFLFQEGSNQVSLYLKEVAAPVTAERQGQSTRLKTPDKNDSTNTE